MSDSKRLHELLNLKDREIDKLNETIDDLTRKLTSENYADWLPEDLPKEQTLPVPRLEMVIDSLDGWRKWRWRYFLVYRHLCDFCVAIPLGCTISSGRSGDGPPRDFNGALDLPFRDGAHIRHDAKHLNLPAFVIFGDEVRKISEV